jgi:hypothetical protein
MRKKKLLMAPLAIVGILAFIAVGTEVVLQLWNWLLPPLFGVRQINFWQALGLLALSRILFGGFGRPGFSRFGIRRRMLDRWEAMTPEERQRFRQGLRGRCGFDAASPSESKS